MLEINQVYLPLEIATQEIGRICRELEKIVKQSPQVGKPAFQFSSQIRQTELVELAKSLLAEREVRARFFRGLDFGEPVWDILLDLYVSRLTERTVSVSSACIAANVPPTTALRYISTLTSQGAILRVLDTNDARRVYLVLPERMMEAIGRYLSHIFEKRVASLGVDGAPSQHGR